MSESPASQAEQLRLKERLAKLRDLPLLRGVGVSGDNETSSKEVTGA